MTITIGLLFAAGPVDADQVPAGCVRNAGQALGVEALGAALAQAARVPGRAVAAGLAALQRAGPVDAREAGARIGHAGQAVGQEARITQADRLAGLHRAAALTRTVDAIARIGSTRAATERIHAHCQQADKPPTPAHISLHIAKRIYWTFGR